MLRNRIVKWAVVASAVIVWHYLTGCGQESEPPKAEATTEFVVAGATATAQPTRKPTGMSTTGALLAEPIKTATPEPTVTFADSSWDSTLWIKAGNPAFDAVASFAIDGAPDHVDPTSVLRAQGADGYGNTFLNTIGLGSEMMFATPGGYLAEPGDHSLDPAFVEFVNNVEAVDWINPDTRQNLGTDTWAANLAEGAFIWTSGERMQGVFAQYAVRLTSVEEGCHNNWFLIARGLFPDNTQDTDRNITAHFSHYIAGHTQVMLYPPAAYIDEGNFLQVSAGSHTGDRNCGREGASGLSVFLLDTNTGAWAVLFQANINEPWQMIASNWFVFVEE